MASKSLLRRKILKSRRHREYQEILSEILGSPAVKYIAAGVAAAILARIANKLADEYPEISNFIKENRENLEGKMQKFKKEFGKEHVTH